MAGVVRGRAFRALAALFSFAFGVASLALLDLVSGLAPPGSGSDRASTAMSNVAFGVVGVVLVAAAYAGLLRRPEEKIAALHQVGLVLVALAVASLAAGVPVGAAAAAVLTLPLGVVVALHPTPRALVRPGFRPSPVLLGLAAGASVPVAVYSWRMADAGRQGLPPENSFAFVPSHWSALVAMALATLLVAYAAAARAPGWPLSAGCVTVAALAFGLGSVLHPDAAGSGGRAWGALTVVWSLAWLVGARRVRAEGQGAPDT